jgi:thiol-disulfide isomerase/thioredoxin
MAKDISRFMIKVEDDAGWENLMELSAQKVAVVDCHQDWCGNVEAILPTMTRVMIEYDNAEDRFQYATASIAKVGGKIQSSLPHDAKIDLEKNGCLPLFAVYRVSLPFKFRSF